MCSQEHSPGTEDPAQLMPRVIAAAWAVLATRPPGSSSRQSSDRTAETGQEDGDV